jgi:hypothetical protein
VGVKKRKLRPSDLVDPYGEWMPLASNGDDVWATGDEAEEEDDDGTGAAGQKRKRYESSVSCSLGLHEY